MSNHKPIGEIVEATSMTFVAQCLDLPRRSVPALLDPPPLGGYVRVNRGGALPESSPAAGAEDEEPDPFAAPAAGSGFSQLPPSTVYGVVYGAATASLEPFRRPAALGYSEEELRRHQPQIFELLRTDFQCLLVACTDERGVLRRRLPAVPPRIHSCVTLCEAREIRELAADLAFLRTLLVGGVSLGPVPVDEIAAACIREARPYFTDDHAFLVQAGKTLASILAEDYERLQAILRKI